MTFAKAIYLGFLCLESSTMPEYGLHYDLLKLYYGGKFSITLYGHLFFSS